MEENESNNNTNLLPLVLAVLAVVLGGAGFYFGLTAKNTLQPLLEAQESSLSESVSELAQVAAQVEIISQESEALGASVSRLRAYGNQRDQRLGELTKEISKLKEDLAKGTVRGASSAVGNGTGEASQLTSDGSYIIQSGDTFSSIAAKSGVRLQSLLDANPGVDPRRLRIAQTIVIPNE